MQRNAVAIILGVLILGLIFSTPFLSNFRFGAQANWYGYRAENVARQARFDATFLDSNGRPVRIADFQGSYLFLFFGYTRCHESCPAWLGRLLALAEKRSEDVHVLFLSIDPRDTPEHLDGYLDRARRLVTSVPAGQTEIAALARKLGYRFQKNIPDGETIHHQDAVYLFDREGRLRLMYPFRWLDSRRLENDLRLLDAEAR